jgi:RNA polymerase sigma-70 factor (ECF subfamily)
MSAQDQSGEHDFGRLFVRYQPRIYGLIRSLVVRRADAEDLLQETASVLWRKFDEFQPGSNFLAWALSVARYQVLYFRQRQKRDVLQFSEKFLDAVGADTVTESARLDDLQELLDQCMDKLPPADRELFEMRYQFEVPPKNMAEQLGRPLSTVYNSINRIRRVLAECVERGLNK